MLNAHSGAFYENYDVDENDDIDDVDDVGNAVDFPSQAHFSLWSATLSISVSLQTQRMRTICDWSSITSDNLVYSQQCKHQIRTSKRQAKKGGYLINQKLIQPLRHYEKKKRSLLWKLSNPLKVCLRTTFLLPAEYEILETVIALLIRSYVKSPKTRWEQQSSFVQQKSSVLLMWDKYITCTQNWSLSVVH